MSSTKYSKSKAHEAITKEAFVDLNGPRKEALFKLPASFDEKVIPMLNDPRDILIVHLIVNIMTTVVPGALFMLLFTSSHWYGLVYLGLTYFFFLQRFILMLHFSEHRKLFKPEHEYLNLIPSYFLAPFFGVPAGVYNMHHVIMHHVENNLFPWDVSSTEPYQRDSIVGYLKYLAYWAISVWFLVPAYLYKRKKMSFLKRTVKNLGTFFLVVYILYLVNPTATTWIVIHPLWISLLAMSFGNYSQHIFIDPRDPDSNYALTYNCVNCTDNQYTFNDGYHIIHHQHSRLHWSELPSKFTECLNDYDKNEALVFKNIGFFDVGVYVVTGQLEKLASHYVQLGDKEKSVEEIVDIFKSRLQPIHRKA
jgi:fatty acid desaturase